MQRLLAHNQLFGKRCGVWHENTSSKQCEMSLLWQERGGMGTLHEKIRTCTYMREMKAANM